MEYLETVIAVPRNSFSISLLATIAPLVVVIVH